MKARWWLLVWLLLIVVLAAAVLIGLTVIRDRARPEVTTAPVPTPSPLPGQPPWYEVHFTTPQREGIPPSGSPGRLDERLVALIDGARQSVDVAAYDLNLENVADALVRAHRRGVRVRVVTDSDNLKESATKKVQQAGIPVVPDDRGAIMHHKFAVIDGQTVITGAWNFADRDTYRHNNNAVVFRSPELARNFTNEFEKMFTGRRFGPTKPKDVPNPVVEVGGTRVETWFASEQDVVPQIMRRVQAARSSIVFMAFSFTLDEVGEALKAKNEAGVGVWGVIERTGSETQFSEWRILKDLRPAAPRPPFPGCIDGPAVVQDGNGFLMHHKVFVLDERTVIFGSFNFTSNAARDNDEALLIVDDPAMARLFLEEFCRVYNVGVQRPPARR